MERYFRAYQIRKYFIYFYLIKYYIYLHYYQKLLENDETSNSDKVIYEKPDENEHSGSAIGNTTLFQGREYEPETKLYYYRARYFDPKLGRFLQPDPKGYIDSTNLYSSFNQNPVNFSDPFGENIFKDLKNMDWGYFLGKTGKELWNVASLGTLNKVEKQKNLGTLSGVLKSTGSGVTSISNTVTFGLQDEIYNTQMNEGAGLSSIWKGTKNTAVNITPYNEIKTILSSDADIGEKLSALSLTISKIAGYYMGLKSKSLMKQYNRSKAAASIRKIRSKLSEAGFSRKNTSSYIRAFDLESIRLGRNINFFKKQYRFFESGKSAGSSWLTSEKSLVNATPIMRKIKLALPANNPATGRAWTRIPFYRNIIKGIVSPQPPSFTGFSLKITTGGVNQTYVMPGTYLKFTVF